MLVALTHSVSPAICNCELTYRDREPIDYDRAVEQHAGYCQLIRTCGAQVVELHVNGDYPDSTFIEDTAVVVDEIAVMANIGVPSRQGEVDGIAAEMARFREVTHVQSPATLDGGDVLIVGKDVFVGRSARTNDAGIASLTQILGQFGYRILPVKLKDCLHLKSACTALDHETLLINSKWFDPEPFQRFRMIHVPEHEPWAANVLEIGGTILMHSGFIKTIDLVADLGYTVMSTDISELLKAEAGMTCSSIPFEHPVHVYDTRITGGDHA